MVRAPPFNYESDCANAKLRKYQSRKSPAFFFFPPMTNPAARAFSYLPTTPALQPSNIPTFCPLHRELSAHHSPISISYLRERPKQASSAAISTVLNSPSIPLEESNTTSPEEEQEPDKPQQLWRIQEWLLRLAQQATVLQEAADASMKEGPEVVEQEEEAMRQVRVEEGRVAEERMATTPALLKLTRRLKALSSPQAPKKLC